MKRATAAIDRLLVVLLGLTLMAGAAFAFAWWLDVPLAREHLSRFDRETLAGLPSHSWWGAALGVAAATSAVVATALLIGNLSPRHTRTLQISADQSLAVRVDLVALARGVAADFASFPGVTSVRRQAIDDRGIATLAVTLRASPNLDIHAFTRFAEQKAAVIADAVQGGAVALRVQVHVDAALRPMNAG